MPLRTEAIDLADERDHYDEEMDEYAEEQAAAPVGSDAAEQAAQEGQRAERFRAGLAWAIAEWDADSVTLAALTNGERHRVRDVAADSPFKTTDCYVAAATQDAPYLAHDPTAITDAEFRETIRNVTDLHPAFVDWVYETASDLSRVDGETGNSYRDSVLAKRRQSTSQTTNG